MKHFPSEIKDKADEIIDKYIFKNNSNKSISTGNLEINRKLTLNEDLYNNFSLRYLDEELEKNFLNIKKLNSIWSARLFKIITLIYVTLNIIIFTQKSEKLSDNQYSSSFSLACKYSLAVLNVLTFILNFYFTKSFLYFTLLYLEYLIFSLSHFIFLNEIRNIYSSESSQCEVLILNFNINSTIAFIFSLTDVLLKLIFIYTQMNNFIFLIFSTFGNFLLIMILFLTSGMLNFSLTPLALIFYFLGNIILIFVSRKFTVNEKNLFTNTLNLRKTFKESQEEIKVLNFIKSGYFKIINNKIIIKNNFFQQEFESLKTLLNQNEITADKSFNRKICLASSGGGKGTNNKTSLKRRKTTNFLNTGNRSSKFINSNINSNHQKFNETCISDEDCKEIIKKLLLNIPDTEKFKNDLNLFLKDELPKNKKIQNTLLLEKRKSVEFALKFKGTRNFSSKINTSEFDSTANILIKKNDKEYDKENISLACLNSNNLTSSLNQKYTNNFITEEENLNKKSGNKNLSKFYSSKLQHKDTKLTIDKGIINPSCLKKNPTLKKLNTDAGSSLLKICNTSTSDQIQMEILNFSIFEYLISKKNEYENFIKLGKSTITNGSDKLLSLEVLVKVNEDNSLEFIFNDVSKYDYSSGFQQFLVKTGQYLHDFKNPLICIQNEIQELKQENEVLMAMIIRHNEFIENSKEHMISISGATGGAGISPAFKIEYSLEECLFVLDKFEYTKQMSEYCQNMIGSYEDFSKSILSPQKVKISIQNFDLLNLLDFIDSMMQYQLSRSNKNIKFILKLVNFESKNNDNVQEKAKEKEKEIINHFYEKNFSTSIIKENIGNENGIKNFKKLNTVVTSNFSSKNIKKKIKVSEKDLDVFKFPEIIGTDEAKLKRVLINILSNSQKFTISGAITLTINKSTTNGINHYKFTISDTGIGMSPEDINKLFTPFFSNNNNEMNKNGVGLGLVNVKEITELLGQGLKVSSELGKGTTMSFVIEDKLIDLNFSTKNLKKNNKKLRISENNVCQYMGSDPIINLDSDITQQVCMENFNSIIKKLPKIDFTEDKDSDRIFSYNNKESEILSCCDNKRELKNLKDFRKEKKNKNTGNILRHNKTYASPFRTFQEMQFPYIRSGYKIVRHSPKVISREFRNYNSNKVQSSKFKSLKNLNAISDRLSTYYAYNQENNSGTDKINSNRSLFNKQHNSSFLRTKNLLTANSLISSSSNICDIINNMSTHNSNRNYFSSFTKLSIDRNINIEVKRNYEKFETIQKYEKHKDKENLSSAVIGLENNISNFNSYRKSHKLLTCQIRSKPIINEELNSNLNSDSLKFFFKDRKKFVQLGDKIARDGINDTMINEEGHTHISQQDSDQVINTGNFSKVFNVLLVDDEQSIRSFSKNSFKKIGESEKIKFIIEEADDGISALNKILYKYLRNQETYDLIISDDTMTFLDGSQLFKLLEILIQNDIFKRKLPLNIINKFLICSSDSENVKNRIGIKNNTNLTNNKSQKSDVTQNDLNLLNFKTYLNNCIEICDKPLNLKFLINKIKEIKI